MIEHFYNGLSPDLKKLYRDIQTQIELFKTEIVFPNDIYETVGRVYRWILEDHPEYFWLTNGYSGTLETIGTSQKLYFRPLFCQAFSRDQLPQLKRKFDAKVSELIAMARRSSSILYEQILFLHDYLVLHTDYVSGEPHRYNAYGCLMLHRAVCGGYAAAFQVLMNSLGVECGRVTGSSRSKRTGEVSHGWNYIRLDDGYYFVDVTWDDPILNEDDRISSRLYHSFFCITTNELLLTHQVSPSNQFFPACKQTKYNYFVYRGWYLTRYSFDAVKKIALDQLRTQGHFSVKFGTEYELKRAEDDLFSNKRIFSIPGIQGCCSSVSQSGTILIVYVTKGSAAHRSANNVGRFGF